MGCLILSFNLQAQYFGIRGGFNFTDATIDLNDLELNTDQQGNLLLGFFVDLPIGTEVLSIQPELNYQGRGYNYELENSGIEIANSFAYLDLGAIVKLNFGADAPVGFYIGAGPFISYALSGTIEEGDFERELDFDLERIRREDLSLAGIAGVAFGISTQFFLEARYLGSLSNQSTDATITIRQNSIGVNAGFRVPLY